MPIDRENAQPLQVQVADDIRRRIRVGEFPAGAKLPALRALTTEYDVAEMTVHAAIRELQREGVVVSSRGRGTYVSDDLNVPAITGVYDETSPEARIEELQEALAELTARVDRLEAHDDKSTADPGAKP